MKKKQFICERCETSFERRNGKRVYRFCSRDCSALVTASKNKTNKAKYAIWCSKFGEEEATRLLAEMIKRRSIRSTKQNAGRTLSELTKKKISKSCNGIPNKLKGKTFVEFYGKERAKELGEQHSNILREGYASGRLSPVPRMAKAPTFRGVRLRSLLEQHAIEFLEKRDNLVFGETLFYEPKETRVQWFSSDGKSHTYCPDLYDTKNQIVYEVKPHWKVLKETEEMRLKMLALTNSGFNNKYLTDNDIHNRRDFEQK